MTITTINATISILWAISLLVDVADFTYLWQLKEYRIDRMKDFFATRQGKVYWLRYQLLWRSLFVIAVLFWPINEVLFLKYTILAMFVFDGFFGLARLSRGSMRHPHLTPKALLIMAAVYAFEGLVIWVTQDWAAILFLTLIRFATVSLVVQLIRVPTKCAKMAIVAMAKRKIERYPALVRIGITGSYGKTSTKEFVAHILSGRYRVIKTPKNTNTEIGVALFILRQDFSEYDVFVVEMGAYRRGEIKYLCNIVHPTIGILTAINEQHLSLFGTIRDTQQAKYELLRSLPKTGYAVVNSDNAYCREFLHELTCSVATFGYDSEHLRPACQITHVKNSASGMSCDFDFGGTTVHVDTPLFGDYHAMNLAATVLVARHLGVSDEAIVMQCKTLTQTTLNTYTYGSCTVIDDSYNSNPDGFRSALVTLSTFPSSRRRIVITRGMLELGDRSDELHERIGEEIAFTANELVLIIRDSEIPLRKGIGTKYHTTIIIKDNPGELLRYVRTLKDTGAVVLLENRIPYIVKKELLGI